MSVDVLLFVPKWPAPAASVFEVGAAVINAQLVQTNQKTFRKGRILCAYANF